MNTTLIKTVHNLGEYFTVIVPPTPLGWSIRMLWFRMRINAVLPLSMLSKHYCATLARSDLPAVDLAISFPVVIAHQAVSGNQVWPGNHVTVNSYEFVSTVRAEWCLGNKAETLKGIWSRRFIEWSLLQIVEADMWQWKVLRKCDLRAVA